MPEMPTNDPNADRLSRCGPQPDQPGGSSDFAAPLGLSKRGRLIFAAGANQVSLKAGRMRRALYRARFPGPAPHVWADADSLTIQYGHSPPSDAPAGSRRPSAEICLNNSIPWEIEFRNGVSGLQADLSGLQLRSLDLLGGASHVELMLAKPAGTTFIYISGGLSQGAFHRPSGVGMRIRVSGAVRELVFDDQHLDVMGGETSLETPGFAGGACGYDIYIAGGASYVTIDKAA